MLDVVETSEIVAPILISIFGNDGSEESHERVFSVSGLFGTEAEWPGRTHYGCRRREAKSSMLQNGSTQKDSMTTNAPRRR